MARDWTTRYSPFLRMNPLQRLVNDLFTETGIAPEHFTAADFPAINIHGTAEDLLVTAEVPGVPPDRLDLSVTGNVLTLRGERVEDPAAPEGAYQRRERIAGTFSRTFRLPEKVLGERAEAQYSDGILRIRIPRSPEAQPRKIPVTPSGESHT